MKIISYGLGAGEEYDAVTIKGTLNVKQRIQQCEHGVIGTIAMIANATPKVINASAGLLTVKDLTIPSAAIEDVRKYFLI